MKHICYIAVLISAFFLSCQHKKSNHVNPETFSVLVNGEKIEMVLIEGNSFKSEHDFICNNDSKNNLANTYPDIAKQWNYDKNEFTNAFVRGILIIEDVIIAPSKMLVGKMLRSL